MSQVDRDRQASSRHDTSSPHRAREPVLGLDVGGVLVDRVAEGHDTSFFGTRPMETPAVRGSFAAVSILLELFEWRVHIVSKAGPRVADLTRQWLGRQGFVGVDGIPAQHVHFVRKRPEKAPICAELGITHFVDDRLDVLAHLESAVDNCYLFTGGLGANPAPTVIQRGIEIVGDWRTLTEMIRTDLEAAR